MIEFNLTLLLQICNFTLTYFLLKRFFFAPVMGRILKRKIIERRLKDEIAMKGQEVINFRNEKMLQLRQFQRDAIPDHVKIVPTEIPLQPIDTTPFPTYTPLHEHERSSLRSEIKALLISTTSHIDSEQPFFETHDSSSAGTHG